ncbi:DUF4252 domain-containing protein [Pseudohalioglobus sediminis]|uniref:DUF4252 domain-containing protein n=1 Tax=Pseudohalioglobus sediminis TaxID=2606449 RepID=A0A5B0X1J1_9GAMM|nr:DUF4252 domain-containing protein [Pseudohalioglobus sediminis]KAA1191979.1 DUF4252 domain-containing protein [Pseudohalioglobus sediminis]
MKISTLLLTLTLISAPAFAAEEPLADRPGYVDFSSLSGDYGQPRVMIDLGSSLLTLISHFKHDDPMAQEALRNLESIRVHVYNTAGDTTPANARMTAINESLQALEWEQIVRVRETDQQVDIYIKYGDNIVHGLTVMAVDEEEAVFINILGDVDPEQLAGVVKHVDVDLDVDMALHTP